MSPVTRAKLEAAYAELSGSLLRGPIASANTLEELEAVRVEALGRKSGLTELLKGLKDLSLEEKRELAPKIQALKAELEALVSRRRAELESAADEASLQSLDLDLSLPAAAPARGRLHPLTQTLSVREFSASAGRSDPHVDGLLLGTLGIPIALLHYTQLPREGQPGFLADD